jgi:hypothetical protein
MITSIHEAVAARAHRVGGNITAAGVTEIDRMLSEQRASDGQADCLRGEVQGAGVHIHSATAEEARHHV